MNQQAQLLKVGGRYRSGAGYFIRTIVSLEGDVVCYMDQAGMGRCSRRDFANSFELEDDGAKGLQADSHET